MLILLSPAKNLNETRAAGKATTHPRLLKEAEDLIRVMRNWSEAEIADLMKVSSKIARLNAERISSWTPQSGSSQAAADMFDGDVYKHLEMATLGENTRAAAGRRLRILSGLYGLLRPTDDVCAYRLEMGRKIPGHSAETLYRFWGSKIARALVEDASELDTEIVINLASDEYSKSVDRTALDNLRLISPRFEEERNGVRKVISFSAKRARGAMARWILENEFSESEDLEMFDVGGYSFHREASTVECPVFVRTES